MSLGGIKKKPQNSEEFWVILMAEDEGFEPPQTESESGVLPLHKSSMSCGQHGYYTAFCENVKHFFQFLQSFFCGRGIAPPLLYCYRFFVVYAMGFSTAKLCLPSFSLPPSMAASPMVKMASYLPSSSQVSSTRPGLTASR